MCKTDVKAYVYNVGRLRIDTTKNTVLHRTKAEKNTKRTLPTTKQVQVEQSFEKVTFQRDISKAEIH